MTKIGINPKIERVIDIFKDVKYAFKRAYKSADIIIFTGGISMGDYDMGKILVQGGRRKKNLQVHQYQMERMRLWRLNGLKLRIIT